MAEVKDLENVEQEATAPAMEETAADSAAPAETRVNLKARWQAIPRKKRRRIIRLCILALLLVIAAVVLLKVLGGKSSDEGEVVTDIVQYGSITSTVQGSGLTKAKNSETITITTVGTVVDVLVAEGETVTAGTPLFTIDSPAAETAVQKARSNVEGYEKQLSQAQKDIAGLNLSAGYAGKLMETVTLNPGDSITKGPLRRYPSAAGAVLQLRLCGRPAGGTDGECFDPCPDDLRSRHGGGGPHGQPHHAGGVQALLRRHHRGE